MLCKVIHGTANNLEKLTNEWLATGKYEITDVQQTQVDSYITLTIFSINFLCSCLLCSNYHSCDVCSGSLRRRNS